VDGTWGDDVSKRRPLSKRWPGAYVYIAKLRAPNGYTLEVELPLSKADGKAMQAQMLELARTKIVGGVPGTNETLDLIRDAIGPNNGVAFDDAGEMRCHTRIAASEK
jgi:hypothetical protein